MKIVFDRAALAADLKIVGSAIPARASKVMQSCVNIDAKGKEVRISATNGEQWVESVVALVEVESEGTCLVDHAKFDEIVRELSGDTIEVALGGTTLSISSGAEGSGTRLKLSTVAGVFPTIPKLPGGAKFSVAAGVLGEMVAKTSPFAADSAKATTPMTSILFHADGKILTAVATDGRWLGMYKSELAEKVDSVKCIFPVKAKGMLIGLCEDTEEMIEASISDRQAMFSNTRTTVITTTIEGTYPAYEDVIAEAFTHEVRLQKKDTLNALRPVLIMTENRGDKGGNLSKGIRVKFTETGVKFSGRSQDGDGMSDALAALRGETLEMALNGTFLAEVLKLSDGEEIICQLNGPKRPVLLTMGAFRAVIMPMNLQD